MSLFEEYAERLAELSGIEFQDEVCARLYHSILGFQTVPSKPQGDAGLDGFSHGGKHGYCCYGLENNPLATNKQRENAIVKKFKSDLRRLFELEPKNKKLVHTESPEMSKILPKGTKLEYIELIANWFDSHRVLVQLSGRFQVVSCEQILKSAFHFGCRGQWNKPRPPRHSRPALSVVPEDR